MLASGPHTLLRCALRGARPASRAARGCGAILTSLVGAVLGSPFWALGVLAVTAECLSVMRRRDGCLCGTTHTRAPLPVSVCKQSETHGPSNCSGPTGFPVATSPIVTARSLTHRQGSACWSLVTCEAAADLPAGPPSVRHVPPESRAVPSVPPLLRQPSLKTLSQALRVHGWLHRCAYVIRG